MRITLKPGAIGRCCKAADISRDELARRVGVSRATAYRLEMGMVDPSPKFIAGLMKTTGKKFESLFDIVAEGAA